MMTDSQLRKLVARFPDEHEASVVLVALGGFRLPDDDKRTEEIIRARAEIEGEESAPCQP
jgi:hypothetical protein